MPTATTESCHAQSVTFSRACGIRTRPTPTPVPTGGGWQRSESSPNPGCAASRRSVPIQIVIDTERFRIFTRRIRGSSLGWLRFVKTKMLDMSGSGTKYFNTTRASHRGRVVVESGRVRKPVPIRVSHRPDTRRLFNHGFQPPDREVFESMSLVRHQQTPCSHGSGARNVLAESGGSLCDTLNFFLWMTTHTHCLYR